MGKNLLYMQEQLNKKLAILLREKGIRNFSFTGLGNSISAGYSRFDDTKPLLLRNEGIEKEMLSRGIILNRYNFSRSQNNCEEHIAEWIDCNYKESYINKMNQIDYSKGPTSMQTKSMDRKIMDKLYPIAITNDRGLQEILKDNGPYTANIVVYNGCTGSFLDNITRNGKMSQKLFYGIDRDIIQLYNILTNIQNYNRIKACNTQVYICGVPNLFGLHFSELINKKIKAVVKEYANVTYVNPVKSKVIRKDSESNKMQLDIHYSKEEYDQLNNNILSSIITNYSLNQALINTDRKLYSLRKEIELARPDLLKKNSKIQKYITYILNDEQRKLSSFEDKELFCIMVKEYLLQRFPYDFSHLEKENIVECIETKKMHMRYDFDENEFLSKFKDVSINREDEGLNDVLEKQRQKEEEKRKHDVLMKNMFAGEFTFADSFDKALENESSHEKEASSDTYVLKKDQIIQDDVSKPKQYFRK